MPLTYEIITVTNFMQNCSIIWCEKTKDAAIVDPGGDAKKIMEKITELNVNPTKILLTHGHLDHVGGAPELAKHFNVPIIGPEMQDDFWLQALPTQSEMFGFEKTPAFQPTQWLVDGDEITLGQEKFQVLHIPGHTPGHVVFYNQSCETVWVGDVLFNLGIGRTDFPKGNFATLIAGIKTKLLPLGDSVAFIPGHGASSTLGFERQNNPFIAEEMPLY